MAKQTTQTGDSSSIIWDNLEEMVRMKVREFIQTLLEAEVTRLWRVGAPEVGAVYGGG